VGKALFVTKIKSVLAVVLVVGLAVGGIGMGVGLSTYPVASAEIRGDQALDSLGKSSERRENGAGPPPTLTQG
jgi:hypothetical protein